MAGGHGLGRGWVVLAGGLCLGAGPGPVAGDVTLEYRVDPGAKGCPGEGAFRERAADAFDFRDPFVAPGAGAASHMRVEIARDAKSFRGTLAMVDGAGAVLASSAEVHENCDALVWMLAHDVSLAVFPAPPPPAPPPPPALTCDPCADREVFQRRLDAIEEKNEDRDAKDDARDKRIQELENALRDQKKKMDLNFAISAGALILHR